MKDEIKEILETINDLIKIAPDKGSYAMSHKMWKQLLDYITNLQGELNATLKNYGNLVKEWKILQEENERLKDLYRRTCNHLFNIGNDELARYFQAQINECNTFTVQGVGKDE